MAVVKWRAVTFEGICGVVEHLIRQDPVLPKYVIGDGWSNRLKGVKSMDTHLMDDEWGGEGHMIILDIKGDSFTVELL